MANNALVASDGGPWTSVGANWTALTGLSKCQVVGGVTEPNALSTEAGQVYTGVAFPNDHISEATITLTQEAASNFELCVRIQSGAYSGYKVAIGGASGSQGATIYRMDAGAATQIAQTIGAPITVAAAGDIWQFVAAGSVLAVYQNYQRVVYVADATYTGGSPGFGQYSSSDITHTKCTSWRGYNLIQQDGIWAKKGVIIPLAAADIASSGFGRWNISNILYEGNAQLLSGTVYKMWFMSGGNAAGNQGQSRYAESTDGLAWTIRSSPVLANFGFQSLVKSAGTYYAFGQSGTTQGTGNVDAYTSSDGIAWTLAASNILPKGGAGAWDAGNIYVQCNPVLIGSTWYWLYGGGANPNSPVLFSSGIATATSLLGPWTKSGLNPVITNSISGPILQVGNTFYTYGAAGPGTTHIRLVGNAFNPAETVRYSSTDMLTWSATPVRSMHCTQLYESVNDIHGNATSCILIDIGGKAYNYYIGAPSDSTAPQYYQISLATAPAPIANIVVQPEDGTSQTNTDGFTSGTGDLSANWATPVGGVKLAIVAGPKVQATTTNAYNGMYYTAGTFSADQYSEITVGGLATSGSFQGPMVRMQSGSFSGYMAQINGGTNSGSPLLTATILKLTSGAGAALLGGSGVPYTVQIGDVFRLSVATVNSLPVLTLFQNGALLAQVVDLGNTYTTGKPGMAIFTATLSNSQINTWAAGNASVTPSYNTGVPGTFTITMRDGTTVAVSIPNGFTATSFLSLLRKSGGVWDNPPDPATAATWWPYRDWQRVFTS